MTVCEEELSLSELNPPALDGPMCARARVSQRGLARKGTQMISLRRIAVWGGAIFLALVFVSIGVSKLQGASATGWAERFGSWGYPANAHYVVGVLEILGGLG